MSMALLKVDPTEWAPGQPPQFIPLERWIAYQRFRDRFRVALDERLYPIGYLDALILSGEAEFLSTDTAAIVFAIKVYPSGLRDVHGLVAAGDMAAIVNDLIPQAEAWGRECGCEGALIESRPGWARVLKDNGYETLQVSVRKAL